MKENMGIEQNSQVMDFVQCQDVKKNSFISLNKAEVSVLSKRRDRRKVVASAEKRIQSLLS